MGAGIALDARLRWPNMFKEYRDLCEAGELKAGGLWWWTNPLDQQRVLCFATKAGWRYPSRIEWISEGLDTFASTYGNEGVTSIAMPRLGASHGGLSWEQVRPLMIEKLEPLESLVVELWDFDPASKDPWFDTLVTLVRSGDALKTLGLTVSQHKALERALASPRITGLAALPTADGVGERTLEKVYEYLFRRPTTQGNLFE